MEALKRNVTPPERLAVTVLEDGAESGQIASDTGSISEILSTDLPSAAVIPILFAENRVAIGQAVATWNERLGRAADQQRSF